MVVVRALIALVGALGTFAAVGSAVRSVVLPRAVPARAARVAFLAVRIPLRALGDRAARRGRAARREAYLSLQGPFGLFAQITTWTVLTASAFSAVLWAVDDRPATLTGVRDAARESGSSLSTLGTVHPTRALADFVAFCESGVGLVLLALAITYLPTIYGAFSRREALVAKLAIRAGAPPTPVDLLVGAWELGQFERLSQLWEDWEDWFLELGETHTSFPQLIFFRSSRSTASWVTAAICVLDAAALARHALEPEADWRGELVERAGIDALQLVGGYLGVPHRREEVQLDRAVFEGAVDRLAAAGLDVVEDRDAAWAGFAGDRARYEALALTLASVADAVPTPWLPADRFTEHRPPILGTTDTHHTFAEDG